jgi:hypothetical protein
MPAFVAFLASLGCGVLRGPSGLPLLLNRKKAKELE